MKITFLGGGNMANALIGGMLKQGFAAADITAAVQGHDKMPSALPVYAVTSYRLTYVTQDGYGTDVNKRGGRVSAGQRQLISFARAWCLRP